MPVAIPELVNVAGVNEPRFVFAEPRTAFTYEQGVMGMVAIHESTTQGELQDSLARAIVGLAAFHHGLVQRKNDRLEPLGMPFTARFQVTEQIANLRFLRCSNIEAEFPGEDRYSSVGTFTVRSPNTSRTTHNREDTLDGLNRRIAIRVIDGLANVIHCLYPGFDVDSKIEKASPTLFSELVKLHQNT